VTPIHVRIRSPNDPPGGVQPRFVCNLPPIGVTPGTSRPPVRRSRRCRLPEEGYGTGGVPVAPFEHRNPSVHTDQIIAAEMIPRICIPLSLDQPEIIHDSGPGFINGEAMQEIRIFRIEIDREEDAGVRWLTQGLTAIREGPLSVLSSGMNGRIEVA